MSDITRKTDPLTRETVREIHEHKGLFWTMAAISLLAGLASIALPQVATFAAELVVGAALLISGGIQAALSFRARQTLKVAGQAAIGALAVLAGLYMLLNPVGGAFALTLVLAAWFMASGAFKLWFAWKLRAADHGRWGWMAVGGLMSLALGAIIFLALPEGALWVLGLLVGIDLVFHGAALVAILLGVERSFAR